jgi:molybdate transport system substrate-binding protein
MWSLNRCLIFLGFGILFGLPVLSAAEGLAAVSSLSIAAASDLRYALDEVVENFKKVQKEPELQVHVSYGSSGSFVNQILQKAPYDLFLAADSQYTKVLSDQGLAEKEFHYAKGHIALWVPHTSKIDLAKVGMNAVVSSDVKRIAIANPRHAPYGKAAIMALESAGLYSKSLSKLVLGENIAQATQFVQTGAAQIGVIALSLAQSEPLRKEGRFWIIPESTYSVLDQTGVILKQTQNKHAYEFKDFLLGELGQKILRKYGLASS